MVRLAPAGSRQEPLDLAAYVTLALLVLIPTVWHNRQAIRIAAPDVAGGSVDRRRVPPKPYGPLAWATAAVALGHFDIFATLPKLRDWLMLALLLTLGAVGIVYAQADPRWRNPLPAVQLRSWGVGLLFFLGAFFFRILFPGPTEPSWEQVSTLPSLTGTLYRILGVERAILVPITLSCLLPVAVWWIGRGLVGPRIALAAGLWAVLQPYAIWSSEFATSLGMSPLLLLLLVAASRYAWRTGQVGGWLWAGLLWGLLWVESGHARFLLLCWGAIPSLWLLWMFGSGREWRLPRARGAWAVAGLVTGLFLWGAPWSSLVSLDIGAHHWAWSPHLPQLMSFWFQPHALALPFAMTLFLPLDGILALLGWGVCIAAWRRTPVLALAALGWLVAWLWPIPDSDQMLKIAHVTLGLSLLLIVVGIGLLTRLVQELLRETPSRVQAALPWTAALLLAIQFPGGVLGENLALNLVHGLRGVDEAERDPIVSLQLVPLAADPAEWATTPVWRSEGVCAAVDADPRGIAIDVAGNQVWVSGGPPGFLISLDLETGEWTGLHHAAGLHEPADILLRGTDEMYLIDAVNNQVMRFWPDSGTSTGVNPPSLLSWPRGFGEGPDDGFWVADTAHSRIVHLDAQGRYQGDLQDTPGFRHVVQPTDVLAVGDKIWIVDPEDAILMEMTEGLIVNGVSKGWTLNGPHLAALSDDTFLMSDPVAGAILHLASNGTLLSRLVLPADLRFPVALDIVVSGDNWLLAVTENTRCQTWLLELDRHG